MKILVLSSDTGRNYGEEICRELPDDDLLKMEHKTLNDVSILNEHTGYDAVLVAYQDFSANRDDFHSKMFHTNNRPWFIVARNGNDAQFEEIIQAGFDDLIEYSDIKEEHISTMINKTEIRKRHVLNIPRDTNDTISRFEAIINNAMAGIAVTYPDGRYMQVNPRWCELTGYEESELLHMRTADHSPDEEKERSQFRRERLAKKEINSYICNKTYLRKDGTQFFVDANVSSIANQSGEVVAIISILVDVSERMQAVKDLKVSEGKYDRLVSNLRVGVYRTTPDGRIVQANQTLAKMLGYSSVDDLKDINVGDHFINDDIRNDHLKSIEYNDKDSPILELRRKDGRSLWVQDYPYVVRGDDGSVKFYDGILLDITDRQKAHEELEKYKIQLEERVRLRTSELEKKNVQLQKEAAERKIYEKKIHDQYVFLQVLIDSIPNAVYYKDTEGRYIGCNKAFLKVAGIDKEEILNKKSEEFLDKAIAVKLDYNDSNILIEDGSIDYECPFFLPSGERAEFLIIKRAFKDAFGTKAGIVGIITDITELKSIQDALRESEMKYRTVAESAITGIAITDPDENYTYVNQAFADMLGYSREEMIGTNQINYVRQDGLEFFKEMTKRRKLGETDNYELPMYRKDDDKIYTRIYASPLTDENGNFIGSMGIIMDISERLAMEEELLRMRKLESIGVLAGGIAHDFNNILTAVLGNVSIAKINSEEGSKVYSSLSTAEQAIKRAESLTNQLLTFARGGTPLKEVTSVVDVLKETVQFAEKNLDLHCSFSVDEGIYYTEIDKTQINQVIYNILINGSQAMEAGGLIDIRVSSFEYSGESIPQLVEGEYIRLDFRDHGPGIGKENITRIFDPYFTTKKSGSGLGLTTAFSIIKNHGGAITVSSIIGEGATFSIFLPKSAAPDTRHEISVPKELRKGRVLIMDDETMIAEALEEIMMHFGFEADLAYTGEKAVQLYEHYHNNHNEYQFVILDLVIPNGMGGKETVRRILEINPFARVIVSSGYSSDPVLSNFQEYGFKARLTKPYTIDTIKQVIEQVLKK